MPLKGQIPDVSCKKKKTESKEKEITFIFRVTWFREEGVHMIEWKNSSDI